MQVTAMTRRTPIRAVVAQAVAAVAQAAPRASLGVLKLVVFALFLVNARSWPLLWHWRVLVRPILDIRLPYYRFLLSTAFLPARVRVEKKAEWLARLCPVGEDPIAFEVREPAWAGPDDCDFNWHLSNSCYPKALDSARFRAALRICPTFFRAGGWMPLAATHFRFVKEIPMFARYEMRMNIAAWDEKWLYVLVRYVTPAKKGRGKGKIAGAPSSTGTDTDEKLNTNTKNGHATSSAAYKKTNGHTNGTSTPLPGSGDGAPFPALHTPGSALPSEAATPLVSRSGSFVGAPGAGSLSGLSSISSITSISSSGRLDGSGHADSDGPAPAHAHAHPTTLSGADLLALAPTEEPDGATLHCVSVSELCFKIGRITVPPAVVLGMEGFHRRPGPTPDRPSAPAENENEDEKDTADAPTPERYTHAHPPPSFARALALQPHADLARGHLRTLQRFLREGWRDVPAAAGESGRWWEDALGGEVEAKRRVNLERIRGVREGMFGAAAIVR